MAHLRKMIWSTMSPPGWPCGRCTPAPRTATESPTAINSMEEKLRLCPFFGLFRKNNYLKADFFGDPFREEALDVGGTWWRGEVAAHHPQQGLLGDVVLLRLLFVLLPVPGRKDNLQTASLAWTSQVPKCPELFKKNTILMTKRR